MGEHFFFYNAESLAIDKLRPIQLASSIGCVVGKFADNINAENAANALNRDHRQNSLPNNLDHWRQRHLLDDVKLTYGLDDFTLAYIECALGTSTDDDDSPLSKTKSVADFDPPTFLKIKTDCALFQKNNLEWIIPEKYLGIESSHLEHPAQAGHDFWLTRNGHGAGFWDGDWDDDAGKHLTKQAKSFGEFDLIVGDDGKIYGSPLSR